MATSTNVAAALSRIVDLRDRLAAKGKALEIKDEKGVILLSGNGSDSLDDVVTAFESISKQSQPSKINISVDTKFVAGYYPNDFVVGVEGGTVSEQIDKLLSNIASPSSVLEGSKTLQKNPETGEWESVNGTVHVDTANEAAPVSGTTKVTVDGKEVNYVTVQPVVGYNDGSTPLKTDIVQRSQEEIVVPIKVINTADGTVVSSDILLSGYYPNNVTVKAVLETDEDDSVINVMANKVVNITDSTEAVPVLVTPEDGFNYLEKVTVNVAQGSVEIGTKVTGNQVTISKSVTPGWVNDDDVTISGDVTVTIAAVENDESNIVVGGTTGTDEKPTGNVTITPTEGYYDGGSITLDIVAIPNNSINEIVVAGNKVNATATIKAGLYTEDTTVSADEVEITSAGALQLKGDAESGFFVSPASSGYISTDSKLDILSVNGSYAYTHDDESTTSFTVSAGKEGDIQKFFTSATIDMSHLIEELDSI